MLTNPQSELLGPKPSLVLRPGQLTLDPGTERYVVKGGGSIVTKVFAGDRLEFVNLEGLQVCELIGIGEDGKFDDQSPRSVWIFVVLPNAVGPANELARSGRQRCRAICDGRNFARPNAGSHYGSIGKSLAALQEADGIRGSVFHRFAAVEAFEQRVEDIGFAGRRLGLEEVVPLELDELAA